MGQKTAKVPVKKEVAGPLLLPSFLAEVAAYCKARHGRATELAAAVGVPLGTVSTWLNGRREPGGEAVLRIQAWLAAQRAEDAAHVARATAETGGRLPLRAAGAAADRTRIPGR